LIVKNQLRIQTDQILHTKIIDLELHTNIEQLSKLIS